LSSRLYIGLPSGLFTWGFLTKTLYIPLPNACHIPCPSHCKNSDYHNLSNTHRGNQKTYTYQSTACNFVEDLSLHHYHRENLKFRRDFCVRYLILAGSNHSTIELVLLFLRG
jgi:hypothetical protein